MKLNSALFLPSLSVYLFLCCPCRAEYSLGGGSGTYIDKGASLWYTKPATARITDNAWMEYGLPIGNGQLGAMVLGGIQEDRLQFNEKTVYAGDPTTRGAYQNFGALIIEDRNPSLYAGGARDYTLSLDMKTATATARWEADDGTVLMKQYIASRPRHCIAVHLTSSRKQRISSRITLEGAHGETVRYADGEASFSGKLDLVSLSCFVKVMQNGGGLSTTADGISVENADEVTIILSGGTDYDINAKSFVSATAALDADIARQVRAVASQTWEKLYTEHVADYSQLFGRVDFLLTDTPTDLPTDELLRQYATDADNSVDRQIEQLLFHYGRYLLIASSRGISLPAGLQGIWNNSNEPPWTGDIHANINVQMNYWPAEPLNLPETAMPFLDYIYTMAVEREEWRGYASEQNQADTGWACYGGNNIFGYTTVNDKERYNAVAAWYCWNLWQQS